MPLFPYALPHAVPGALRESFDESVFLLDENGTVIAARQKEPLLKIGDSFWRAMHVLREERQELEGVLRSFSLQSFLFMAGDRPAVAWCYFYARTRLLAVFLPEGDIRRCLSAPAAYADILATRHLLLSRGALARYLPQDELLYSPTDLWLRHLERPLFDLSMLELPIYNDEGKPLIEASPLIELLTVRVSALAALVGVSLDADWQGIGFAPLPFPDLAWLTACLLLLFLAVRRTAANATVTLRAVRERADGPVIEASFAPLDPQDPLPELSPLLRNACWRNELFEIASPSQDQVLILLRFSMCRKELSVLGLKIDPRLRN